MICLSTGPNFMESVSVSRESALMVIENPVPTVGVFHGLARNFSFCACVFCVTKDSVLITEVRNFCAKVIGTELPCKRRIPCLRIQ